MRRGKELSDDVLLRKDILMTEGDAARYLAVSPKTLQTWRLTGAGPVYCRYSGRCCRYRLSDLNVFLRERLRTSTSDTGTQLERGNV